VSATDTNKAIDAVWRIESPRLIAGLARVVRDVGLAEDLAHDALVAALEQWPESGIPRNPGAWLMATGRHRAIDLLRRRTLLERKHQELGYELEIAQDAAAPDLDVRLDIAGTGELLDECRVAAARDARIRVHGFVAGDAKEALFGESHVLVCPSTWWEVTGIVILEAYARGLPAIGSRIGGIPEVIDHGRTGFLVRPGDAGELGARLRELASNRGLLQTLAKSALAHAGGNRVDTMAARLAGIYAEVRDAVGRRRDI